MPIYGYRFDRWIVVLKSLFLLFYHRIQIENTMTGYFGELIKYR